jgi:GDP-L-fucose synthase
MYGPFDNFDLETSHVLPAFINRFVSAAKNGAQSVTVWGSGKPRREFLHSDDLAKATLIAAEKYDAPEHLNVGTGEDVTIAELAKTVASESGFTGEIKWDSSKPDGTLRKVLDVTNIKQVGWAPEIPLKEGIASTIEWFKENENRLVKRY